MSKEKEKTPIIDRVADKAAERVENAAEAMKVKKDFLVNNIRSKTMIEKYLHGKLEKEELAIALAEDKDLKKTTEHVVEGIINPEPTEALKAERDPVALDFGYGLSVFWEEINTPIDQKVNAAADVRDILGQVDIATDPTEAPKIREEIYKDLGLDEEEIDSLIPESEKLDYMKALEDHYKNEHMERLDLKDDGMLDIADEERLKNLVDDSMAMAHSGYEKIPPNFNYHQEPANGYVEEYGMTPEELNMFYADAYGDDVYDYPPYEEIDQLAEYPTMSKAIKNIEDIYAGSLEDNIERLSELESMEASMPEAGFSEDDLTDLNDEYLEHLENNAPPENLRNNTPPILTDDDLSDLDMGDKDIQI